MAEVISTPQEDVLTVIEEAIEITKKAIEAYADRLI